MLWGASRDAVVRQKFILDTLDRPGRTVKIMEDPAIGKILFP